MLKKDYNFIMARFDLKQLDGKEARLSLPIQSLKEEHPLYILLKLGGLYLAILKSDIETAQIPLSSGTAFHCAPELSKPELFTPAWDGNNRVLIKTDLRGDILLEFRKPESKNAFLDFKAPRAEDKLGSICLEEDFFYRLNLVSRIGEVDNADLSELLLQE